MTVYWAYIEDGRCAVVWRWSASTQRLAKMVEILTKDGSSGSSTRNPADSVIVIKGEFR